MAGAFVKVRGARGVQRMIDDMEFGPWITRALLRCAYLVQANSTTSQIIRGGVKGAPAHPTRLTSRTGLLRASIGVDRTQLASFPGPSVEVGSNLVYAARHEYGYPKGNTPARPYLQPALEGEAPKFPAIFMRELDRELAEHRGQVGP